LIRHPDADRIARGLSRCLPLASAWHGAVFRCSGIEYANSADVATGEGGRKAGGRFNPPESFPALYNAVEPETAVVEALADRRRRGLPDAEALPLVLVALQVNITRVLNLTDGRLRRTLGVSWRRLMAAWRPDQERGREALTQAVGRLARETGFQAILYKSARRSGGLNLAIFPDRLPPGELVVVNQHKLPVRRQRPRNDL
jgi:RES domain-containing protein